MWQIRKKAGKELAHPFCCFKSDRKQRTHHVICREGRLMIGESFILKT